MQWEAEMRRRERRIEIVTVLDERLSSLSLVLEFVPARAGDRFPIETQSLDLGADGEARCRRNGGLREGRRSTPRIATRHEIEGFSYCFPEWTHKLVRIIRRANSGPWSNRGTRVERVRRVFKSAIAL